MLTRIDGLRMALKSEEVMMMHVHEGGDFKRGAWRRRVAPAVALREAAYTDSDQRAERFALGIKSNS